MSNLNVKGQKTTERVVFKAKAGQRLYSPAAVSARTRDTAAPLPPVTVNTGAITSFWSTKFHFVGAVALDYLTLTTFSLEAYAAAVRLLDLFTPLSERKTSHLMQYAGASGDGYFFGVGEQKGVPHYLLRFSGSVAHCFLEAAIDMPELREFKATRIDVQYTHDDLVQIDLPSVAYHLRSASWPNHRGQRPSIDLYDNEDGLNTLYIGKRSSVRFTRIYIKELDSQRHLRWETEYKRDLAEDLWHKLLEDGAGLLPHIMAGEIAYVPLADTLCDIYEAINYPPTRLVLRRDSSDATKALLWLWNSVLPAIRKLQKDERPKLRNDARDFLKRALLADPGFTPPSGYFDWDIEEYLTKFGQAAL